mmetsp:Transcript_29502/g.77627  ORF Transcript_29502/g.77627 Transcript_29502/m.77627 type:complete len:158 (-) Transcript_29502:169-642(-)
MKCVHQWKSFYFSCHDSGEEHQQRNWISRTQAEDNRSQRVWRRRGTVWSILAQNFSRCPVHASSGPDIRIGPTLANRRAGDDCVSATVPLSACEVQPSNTNLTFIATAVLTAVFSGLFPTTAPPAVANETATAFLTKFPLVSAQPSQLQLPTSSTSE